MNRPRHYRAQARLAWHVWRGRALVYNAHFVLDGDRILIGAPAGQGPIKVIDNGFGGHFEGHAEVFVADFGKGMLYPLRIDGRSP